MVTFYPVILSGSYRKHAFRDGPAKNLVMPDTASPMAATLLPGDTLSAAVQRRISSSQASGTPGI